MTTNRLNKRMVMIIWEKNIFQKGKKKDTTQFLTD